MRSAQIVWAVLAPHLQQSRSLDDFMLFPDDLPENADKLTPQERRWVRILDRSAK